MTLKELFEKSEKHPYYCNITSYKDREYPKIYENFSDFMDEFGDANISYNLCFRWDLKTRIDDDSDDSDDSDELKEYGPYWLEIFIIQQRKGNFYPIVIERFKEEDVDIFIEYLQGHKKYLGELWNV